MNAPQPIKLTREQKRLVEQNIRLARFLARTVWEKNRGSIDLEEVTSVAYQGLVSAALKYDPHAHGMSQETIDNGKAFAGYARLRINGAIGDWQRTEDHVQRSYRALYKGFVTAGYGQGVSLEEAAKKTEVDIEKAREVVRAIDASPVSLDLTREARQSVEGANEYAGGVFTPDVSSDRDVEGTATESMILVALQTGFDQLTRLQRTIIVLRYFRHREVQSIAKELGLAVTKVRMEHAAAVDLLYDIMRDRVE